MSTTISGTNGVTFPDSTSMQTGQQACKAWVNFNGTGTVAIRGEYNVSSITDNGTGDYTVNFTTAMVDANYAVVTTGGDTPAGTGGRTFNTTIAAKTTTTAEIISALISGSVLDCPAIDVAIFSN